MKKKQKITNATKSNKRVIILNDTTTYRTIIGSEFTDAIGADEHPDIIDKVDKVIPLGRLGQPEEAAHFAMTLLDGINTYQAGNFFCHSGGINNEGI